MKFELIQISKYNGQKYLNTTWINIKIKIVWIIHQLILDFWWINRLLQERINPHLNNWTLWNGTLNLLPLHGNFHASSLFSHVWSPCKKINKQKQYKMSRFGLWSICWVFLLIPYMIQHSTCLQGIFHASTFLNWIFWRFNKNIWFDSLFLKSMLFL